MTYLIVLLAIGALLAAATIRMAVRDGTGPQRPPASHAEDQRFWAPRAR